MRLALLLAPLLALAALPLPAAAQPVPGKTYKIGFSQIVDHPALNATRQGFHDELNREGFIDGKNLVFEYANAQGDVGQARNINEKFIADGVDLLAPCTTPNVQAAIRLTRGTSVPVAFGCVTNPVPSGILTSMDAPTGSNVTGSYGLLPVQGMFDLLQAIAPKAKKVGTIYNGAESNSVTLDKQNKAEAEKRGLTWIEVQIAGSAEIKTAADTIADQADTFLMPQDNTVASGFDAILKDARDHRIPLFSFDSTAVERGAIASLAVDQYQTGVEWAKNVAIPVLLGKAPGTLTPVRYSSFGLFLNTAAAARAGVTIPAEMLAKASKVYDK